MAAWPESQLFKQGAVFGFCGATPENVKAYVRLPLQGQDWLAGSPFSLGQV